MTLLTHPLKALIGQKVHYPAREPLGQASIRYFALATHDDNPLYLDDTYAQAAGHAGVIAPPTLVCDTCQYAHREPSVEGYIGHEWHLPVIGCRMIRAGNDYTFIRPVLATDRISVTWTLESMVEKPSSRGGTQLFVMSVATYADAQGFTVATNRETLVFQPMASHAQTQP
jgi:acyl dehydratase